MGNIMLTCRKPVVAVHHRDGSTILKYYKRPVFVKDVLKEHPDYFVVSMSSSGRTTILSSDLDLQTGGKYCLLPQDHFFKATSALQNTPQAQICRYCPRACGNATLRRVVARCSSKLSGCFTVNMRKAGSDREKVDSMAVPWKSSNTVGDTGPDIWEKEGSLISIPWQSPNTEKSYCSDGGGDGICVPWKFPKKVEDGKRGSISRQFSREQWLEDMIRGAENQLKRVTRLGQTFLIEDAQVKDVPGDDLIEAKQSSWRFCLPSSARISTNLRSTSFAKEDEFVDTSLAIEGRESPCPQSPESSLDYSGAIAMEYFQQLPKEVLSGDHSGRRSIAISSVMRLQSEIEQMDRPELMDGRDNKSGYDSSSTLKTDEMERRSLLRSSLALPPPPVLLQKYSTIDTASRRWSLNVDRG